MRKKLISFWIVTGNDSAFQGVGTNTVTYEAIQKIPREAATDYIDGARYAKNVYTV